MSNLNDDWRAVRAVEMYREYNAQTAIAKALKASHHTVSRWIHAGIPEWERRELRGEIHRRNNTPPTNPNDTGKRSSAGKGEPPPIPYDQLNWAPPPPGPVGYKLRRDVN